ncbi:hypothetical protein Celal_1710 [Cellulophaga algicola DSM 14237]|uniref:Lipoprotein n=1 Tax=Cellulophaga algicola (strain DSM 14237 / IC166 / ACAM 630) TaxID=688270 RepID=E6XCM2_CELAD|nr:hypothetical protein [Cellulophaga algicola]ADV49011.1 hypothetical protein Celal_1710 [Cellulophaga algicola DSM 14237]
MKKALIVILLAILSCKTDKNNVAQKEIETEIVSKKSIEEIKYVIAKSGLIYRDKAKGKPLGKFELNSKLNVIEHTAIFQEIKDKDKIVKGEWVGVKLDKNRVVYVFDGFLSTTKQEYSNQIKKYLENGIWVLKEFKNSLYKDNDWSDVTLSNYDFVNIIFKDERIVIWSPYDTEEYSCSLNDKLIAYYYEPFDKRTDTIFEISKITASSLTIKIKNKKYDYFKVSREITENDLYNVVQEGSDNVLNEWFSGIYIFKDNDGKSEIKFNSDSKSIYMLYPFSGRFLAIDLGGYTYKIHRKEVNTYHLERVYYSPDADGYVFTEEKSTLTKVK